MKYPIALCFYMLTLLSGFAQEEPLPQLHTIDGVINELLDQILNPSRKIDPKYLTYIVETTAGRVFTGLLVSRTDKQVVIRDTKNQQTVIPAEEIEELVAQRKSLMPELLLKDMTAQQVADLLAFLASLKTPPKAP